jgi:dTDP-glucose 4,6-dehydratase
MSKLLLIGGSGFFGKSILDAYRRGLLAPWSISSISVLARHASSLKQSALDLLDTDIELIDSDISNCISLPSADYVIHSAASTDAARYLSRSIQESANILAATSNYCQLAKRFHRDSKIVYTSSGAVYGHQKPSLYALGENHDSGAIELLDLSKQNYAAAKRDGERAIIDLGQDGLRVSIARCFAFVGFYLPRDQHFAIGNFIRDGLSGNPINVKARHEVFRSYMYADDLVVWLMTIADNAKPNCPVFNVGSDEVIELRELAKKVAKIFNVKAVSSPLLIDGKPDRYIPSLEKAMNYLNLKLRFSLDEALDLTVGQILGSQSRIN